MSSSAVIGGISGVTPLGCGEMERVEEEEEKKKEETGESSGNGVSKGEEEKEKEKEKMSRKLSQASLCSMDNIEEEEEENGGGESDEEEVKDVLLLGPQVSLKDQLELDKDDESLRRWKQKLLGSVDLSAIGELAQKMQWSQDVKILSLSIVSPDRPDVLSLPFVANNKGYAFALKDGSHYRLKFTFTVSKNIVVGL